MPPVRTTYQLRRLRLHGLIARQEGTHRYVITDFGLRVSLFFTRCHARILRPGLSIVMDETGDDPPALRRAFGELEAAFDRHVAEPKMAS